MMPDDAERSQTVTEVKLTVVPRSFTGCMIFIPENGNFDNAHYSVVTASQFALKTWFRLDQPCGELSLDNAAIVQFDQCIVEYD